MAIHTSISLICRGRACLALAIAGALLAGCAVGPDFQRAAAPSAKGYAPAPIASTTAASAGVDGQSQQLISGADVSGQWWSAFGSTALDALVSQALQHSPDIAAGQAALRAAQEQLRAQRGFYLPTVSASLAPSRQKTGQQLSSALASDKSLYSLTTAQVSVSYSPDLWGGNRRQVESLQAQAEQQRFELEAVYQTLTANVVNAAVTQAALAEQVAISQAIVTEQRHVLDSLRRQQTLGQVAQADVLVQQNQLAQTQGTLPALQRQLAQQGDLLALLTGQTPDAARPTPLRLDQLRLPAQLPVSLPATLVAQRPDVRAAEAQMHAAEAQIGVAKAARLPGLEIDAGAGSAAGGVGSLFGSGGGFWNLGSNLAQTLFDGGTLKHRQRAAEALYVQQAEQYRGTVLAALQNVADALYAIQADAQALQAASAAEQAAAAGMAIAQQQLAAGDMAANQALLAQMTQQQAMLNVLQARAARYSDTVALFQALGGGWWHRQDVATVDR